MNQLRTRIKFCGITRAEDAQAAAALGVDALGFIFVPGSPRCMTLDAAVAIRRRLPPLLSVVTLLRNPDSDEVWETIDAMQPHLLQFHGEETPEFCLQFGIMTMKAFRIENAVSLLPITAYFTDAFLLDSHVKGELGGTGETFNWDLAVEAKKFGKPIFLAGGLTLQNVADAVRRVAPLGVDVSSGVEKSRGIKDVKKMQDFVAAVRGA